MKNKGSLVGILALALLFACKTQKIAEVTPKNIKNLRGFTNYIESNRPEYKWLNAKVSIDLQTPARNLNGKATLKMRKDSLIWLSVSPALGIEVARIQVTRDSMYILNRMENTIKTIPVTKIDRYLGDRDFGLKNMGRIMIGQPAFSLQRDYEFSADSSEVHLTKKNRVYTEKMSFYPRMLKTKQYNLTKPANNKSVNIDYTDYQKVEDHYLPGNIQVKVQNPAPISLNLDMNNMYFEKNSEVSFNIPSSYERIN